MTASPNADVEYAAAAPQVASDSTTASVTSPEGEGEGGGSSGGAGEGGEEASAKTAANSESEEAKEEPVAKSAAYYSGPPPPAKGNRDSKNSFHPFGEYIASIFNKAEVYEEELERQHTVRQLQMVAKHKSFEGGYSSDSEDGSVENNVKEAAVDNVGGKITETAAEKEKHSLYMEEDQSSQKKQRVTDEAPTEMAEVDDESMKKKWKKQWEHFVVGKKKERLPEVAIEKVALPLSVDEFALHVLSDNATHSIGKFMCDIGELKVDTTPWETHPTLIAKEKASRVIRYTHPVNAPMAPPRAKAFKKQHLHKFGDNGLCLETCTEVEEVPMADCFVVNDRLWVHEAEDGDGGCIVSVTFQIKFVKVTMFRRIIENATRKEYAAFYDKFADMVRSLKRPSSLEEKGELEEVASQLKEATKELERVSSVGGEGKEVTLSSALNRIRISSRRLSVAAKLPQSNGAEVDLEVTEEKSGIGVPRVFALFIVAVFFFMVFVNLMAIKQITMINHFLHDLNSRLERMNNINEGLLSKLASSDESCSGLS